MSEQSTTGKFGLSPEDAELVLLGYFLNRVQRLIGGYGLNGEYVPPESFEAVVAAEVERIRGL